MIMAILMPTAVPETFPTIRIISAGSVDDDAKVNVRK
jgi:hypothetical protein